MKSIYKKYFYFSKKERAGIIVILLSIIISMMIYNFLHKKDNSLNKILFVDLDLTFYQNDTTKKDFIFTKKDLSRSKTKIRPSIMKRRRIEKFDNEKVQLFSFDPNKISVDSLELLSVPKWIIRNIDKYRNAGGQFYEPEDLKIIYGMEEGLYNNLLPFIKISSLKKKYAKPKFHKEIWSTIELVSINTADHLSLEKLRGIGPTLAKRILNFRDALGGFYSVDQLKSVYNLPDSTFEFISDFIIIDQDVNKSIAINIANIKELSLHPYISRKQAKIIHNYRKINGPYHSINDLKKIKIVSEEWLQKVKPYINWTKQNEDLALQ